MLIEE
jgi:alpha-soluble NSF attachment protein